MTLRELTWAALGAQQAAWTETTNFYSWIHQMATGERIDPGQLNPFAPPPPAKTEASKRRQHRMGWAILDGFFGMTPEKKARHEAKVREQQQQQQQAAKEKE